MERISDAIGLLALVVGIVSLLIYVSRDRGRTTKKIMTLVLLILLPLAFVVYPEGIMSIPLASLTLGEIGKLFISGILVLCFIVGEFLLIRSIRGY